MYNLEKFKNEDVFIRITSLEQYIEVMEWLDNKGIEWANGEKTTEINYWYKHSASIGVSFEEYGIVHDEHLFYEKLKYKELKPNKKGENNMTTNDKNMKELYATIEKVYFNEEKRTTVIKFKDGKTVKATATKGTKYSEYFGFVAALMKSQFGKVENIETFIKRKGERK